MGTVISRGGAREQSISAVITRKDGTKINIGTIAYYHKNPLKRLAVNVWIRVKRAWLGV